MIGRFTPQFLEDLIARVDIVDLIDARLPLKSNGANLVACCPFHTEKTPSFTVSRTKQFYHCFGCGAHGDAIAFLMAFDRLAFPEAVTILAQTAGVPLPDTPADDPHLAEQRRHEQRLYAIQDRAAQFYARHLKARPQGAKAADYLRQRGITGETARRFRLGYAPPGWNNFPPDWDQEDLRAAGLTVIKDARHYDRFRDRIIFPIRDRRGRTVGFGGRVLDGALPKYLNSPETAVFKKHREVYGLFEALETNRTPERIIVVEGYLDVIALAQFGLTYAVATLGTATSADHIALLFRYTDELVFCFDGDAAGIKAAWKALHATLPILPDGRTARFLRLPDNHDPDSLIRQEGADAFQARLSTAPPLSDYFFSELGRNTNLETIEGRAKLVKVATPLLNSIKPGPFRQMMQRKLADLTTRKPSAPPNVMRRWDRKPPPTGTLRPSGHFRMLALLTAHPRLVDLIDETTRTSAAEDPMTGQIFATILSYLREHPETSAAALREHLQGLPRSERIDDLLSLDPLVPDDGVETEFRGTLRLITQRSRERRLDELIVKSRSGELDSGGREEMRRLIVKPTKDN